MSFTPPSTDRFRRFVAIDTHSVAAALAALDGGAISEIITRTTDGGGSEGGAELGIKGAKVRGGRSKHRKVEEELRRVRTEHSAASILVDRLREAGSIGEVEGSLDDGIANEIRAGMVIHFIADVTLHPLYQATVVFEEYATQAPKFGVKEGISEVKSMLKLLKAMLGTDRDDPNVILDFADPGNIHVRWLGSVPASGLQVPLEDLQSQAHVVAQVDSVHLSGSPVHALRLVRGAPPSKIETEAAESFADDFGEAIADIGISLGRNDVLMPPPSVMLRVLCMWR